MSVRTPDIVRSEIRQLKDATGSPWREIAQLDRYSPIPFGTLSSIYNGYPVPKRWYKRLGILAPVPTEPCPICGEVHTKGHPKARKPRTPRNTPGKVWLY